MNRDLLFRLEEGVFNVRSAGVYTENGCILLQREAGGSEYAVPGGQVRLGESAQKTVEREYAEETGIAVRAERLLWIEECFWELGGISRHSLTFYFTVRALTPPALSPDSMRPSRDNPGVEWGLVPFSTLKGLAVYPSFLPEALENPSGEIRHFVERL